MIKDFINGVDIHTATASRVLGRRIDDIEKKDRALGKTVNFGMIFGQTPFGLSRLLGIDSEKASEYINAYFKYYEGVEEYMRSVEREAFVRGYVQSMFGTTRNISGIRSRNIRLRSASAREAINMPIQGSEADIMKYVMIKLGKVIEKEYKDNIYMILQIHDEIVLEVKDTLIKKFSKEAFEIMRESISLCVPLEVNVSNGDNLAQLK
jgi:DNA polymerase-1